MLLRANHTNWNSYGFQFPATEKHGPLTGKLLMASIYHETLELRIWFFLVKNFALAHRNRTSVCSSSAGMQFIDGPFSNGFSPQYDRNGVPLGISFEIKWLECMHVTRSLRNTALTDTWFSLSWRAASQYQVKLQGGGGNVSSTSIIIRCVYWTDLKSAYPLRTFNSGSTGLMFTQLLTTFVFCVSLVATAPTLTTVKLDGATVSGKASGSVQEFLGIPFAQPPLIYFCLFEAERSNLID